jgi:hypothetical protein
MVHDSFLLYAGFTVISCFVCMVDIKVRLLMKLSVDALMDRKVS